MTAMKRKGPTIHYTNEAIHTVTLIPPTVTTLKWEETRQQLQEICSFTALDNLLLTLEQFDTVQETASLLQTSQKIQCNLAELTDKENLACEIETADIFRLQMELHSCQADHDDLEQELQDMAAESSATKDQIYEALQICQQEMEQMDEVEAERMRHVPKLKEQISLMATTTGIKWDYEQEEVLAGHIAIPSIQGYCRFSIDPKMHTKFEIANYLWSVMEGVTNPVLRRL